MPTPKKGYAIEGVKVPGVTTIIGRFKQSDALIGWAAKCAREGKNHNEVRDRAAAVGSAAHDLVERFLASDPLPKPSDVGEFYKLNAEDAKLASGAFKSWRSWYASLPSFELEAQEVQLTHGKHRFGGTPDCVAIIDGKRCLLDWKTSKAVNDDHMIQAATYRELWEWNMDKDNPIDRIIIVHLHKSGKKASEHEIDAEYCEQLWDIFLTMRRLYDKLDAVDMAKPKRWFKKGK